MQIFWVPKKINFCHILYSFKKQQGGSRTTCLVCFRDHILLQSLYNRFENTSKYVDTLTLFSKNLNQRSLTPRWPFNPMSVEVTCVTLPKDHCVQVSKSHDNTSMYVDTVINFAKYHIHTHTTYILHTTYIHTTYRMSDHIVSYWTQFRRDKKKVAWHPSLFFFLNRNFACCLSNLTPTRPFSYKRHVTVTLASPYGKPVISKPFGRSKTGG